MVMFFICCNLNIINGEIMENKELKIEYIEIEKLKPFENNSKIHTREQIEHIANSIKEFGFNDPLGIAGSENIVLEGNGRVEAAKLLRLQSLPCVRLDHMTKEEQQAYVIAHNSLNLETGFDNEILLNELQKLQSSLDFSKLGFDKIELEKLQNINDEYYKQLLSTQTKKLVRNQFKMVGEFDIPLIKKQNIDLNKIKLYSYSNAKYNDIKNKNKTIHFFLHDYRFEHTYSDAEIAIEKIRQYYAVCTPDFSLYTDMPLLLQCIACLKIDGVVHFGKVKD